jgi:hypothetical protein
MIIQPSSASPTGKTVFNLPVSQPPTASRAANSADTVTISQAAREALATALASAQTRPSANADGSAVPADSSPAFQQGMAEKFAGGNAIRTMIQNDPSNPMWANSVDFYAEHDFTAGVDVLYDISHTMPGASGNPTIDGILRYSSGEPVTAESQAYVTKQTANYQNQLQDMISSEKAKGTSPSDILLKVFDQQGQQPARFRSMMEWPIASDFAASQAAAPRGVNT